MAIRHHAKLISELTSSSISADTTFLAESSMPLDWRITHPRALIEMAKRRSVFPETISELDFVSVGPYRVANWLGSYFWHDHMDETTFDTVKSKFAHTGGKFFAHARRRLFVLSNTQSNLCEVERDIGDVDFTFSAGLISDVKSAIETMFDDGQNELLVVTCAERSSGDVSAWTAPTYLIDIHTPEHEWLGGDMNQWGRILREYFTRFP